jgi:hypothetical protein
MRSEENDLVLDLVFEHEPRRVDQTDSVDVLADILDPSPTLNPSSPY